MAVWSLGKERAPLEVKVGEVLGAGGADTVLGSEADWREGSGQSSAERTRGQKEQDRWGGTRPGPGEPAERRTVWCTAHGREEVLGTAQSVLTDTSAGTEGQDSLSSTAFSAGPQLCARPCAPDPRSGSSGPTWELVRSANSWAPFRPPEARLPASLGSHGP